MLATPPVGRGLMSPALKAAKSPLLKLLKMLATASSRFCHESELMNRASNFAIEQFKLPLRNVVGGLPRTDFYVPGSILRIELDTNNPIAKGMPKESIAWVENSPVFEVSGTGVSPVERDTGKMPVPQVKVIAWYAKDRDPLLSGWLLGGDRIKGKAALVEVGMGKGRIILFGFRPQYRGQSLATYPLFFNAITQR